MKAYRIEIRYRPMLEGVPLHHMLNHANKRTIERTQREAEERAFTDDDLTDGERLFGADGKAVKS